MTARRDDEIAGDVDTSAGRVYTRDTYQREFRNAGQVSDHGLAQSIDQTDRVKQTSTSTRHGRVARAEQLIESYPISVDFDAALYQSDQNFELQGTVHMGQDVVNVRADRTPPPTSAPGCGRSTPMACSSRTDGVTSESDGSSRTKYVGTDDRGRPYHHRIVSEHGQVVRDVVRRG